MAETILSDRRTFSAVAMLFLAATIGNAQMQTKQTVDGVTLDAPGSAEFQAAVDRIGATATVNQLGPAKDYFVAIEFNTPTRVSGYRTLFELTNGPLESVRHLVRRVNGIEPVDLGAGAVMLAAPAPLDRIANEINSNPKTPLPSTPLLGDLAGRAVTASVDSVTRADGTFVGPDTLNLYDRLVNREAAVAIFFERLRSRLADGTARSWLQSVASTPPLNNAGERHGLETTDLAGAAVYKRAAVALQMYDGGKQTEMQRWISVEGERLRSAPKLRRAQ